MALVKKCKHGRSRWDHCGCRWYDAHSDPANTRRRIYTGLAARDPDEARLEYDQMQVDRRRRRLRAAGMSVMNSPEVTIADASAEWLRDREKLGRAPGTIRKYRSDSARFVRYFGDVPIRDWTPDDIRDFAEGLVERNYKANTYKSCLDTLAALLRWAAKQGVPVPDWPDDLPDIVDRKRDRIPLPKVLEILDGLPAKYRPFGEFLLLTGLRLSEGLGVQRANLHGNVLSVSQQRTPDNLVRRPKTEQGNRKVVLSPKALALLPDTPPDAWCFPWSHWTLRDAIASVARNLGLPPGTGWHVFRHANAELREMAGEGVRTQSAQLGHTAAWQTLSYGAAPESSADRFDGIIKGLASDGGTVGASPESSTVDDGDET